MATRLYLENPYLQQFSSVVSERTEVKGRPGLILEQTAFYPSAGGQPHDNGTIDGIAVIDVFEDDDHRIVHLLKKPVDSATVTGVIDWRRRFDHMQQHTGQHLLSQAFVRKCRANTISFHLGETSATIDLDCSGLDDRAIAGVEDVANRIIYENRPVTPHIVDENQLGRFPVRGKTERQTGVRIIEIEDFDFSPCGGTHCGATGEIGIVRISRCEPHKGGLRVHFLCGRRAFADYRRKAAILKTLTTELSTAEAALPDMIQKRRQHLEALQRENADVKQQMITHEARALVESSDRTGSIRIISEVFTGRDQKEVKQLARTITENYPDAIVLFGVRAAGKATLLFMRSDNLPIDMARLIDAACCIIEGRGGGRPQAAQGGGSAGQNIEKALQNTKDTIAAFYK